MFDFSENIPLISDLEENPLNYVPEGGGSSGLTPDELRGTRSSSNLRQLRQRIDGTDDADLLRGTNDADTINGGAGNDTLNGLAGADVLQGGDGNDIYRLNASNSGGVLINDSAGDNDRLNLGGANLFRRGLTEGRIGYIREGNNLIIDLNRNAEVDAANDVTIENFFADDGTAGEGYIERVDNLTGEVILSTSGVITTGSNSDDTLVGSANRDFLNGGRGNDYLVGKLRGPADGADELIGGAGNDQLLGRQGNDNLDGGTGNDKLSGAEGNDTLVGGGGSDTLQGGPGRDLYQLNANNAGGSIIADTNGNDTLELAGANLRNEYGFVRGQVGYERIEDNLIIDLNENGRYDVNQDLTIESFYQEGSRRKGKGFIEQVDNLSGRDIQLASPVFYQFSIDNLEGDAGIPGVSGILTLPASVLTNENPNRTFEAMSVKVTEATGFADPDFVPDILAVDWTEDPEVTTVQGLEFEAQNEFSVLNGRITGSNFLASVPNPNDDEFKHTLALRSSEQPSDPDPLRNFINNLTSLDGDWSTETEGCQTPSNNGDCALDVNSPNGSIAFRRVR